MNLFKTINSEIEIKENIDKNLKLFRDFDQTSFYLDEGAEVFYSGSTTQKTVKKINIEESVKILEKLISQKNKKIAFISLGAGNSSKETPILDELHNKGYDFAYFGVDCSMSMLELSEQVLKDSKFEKHLICADFASSVFKKEIHELVGDFDIRIFMMLGNTFGNVPQSYMADTLKKMVQKNDFLWLEINRLEEYSEIEASKNFEKAMAYLEDPTNKTFLTYPLTSKKISLDYGELTLEMVKDNSLESINFKFGFSFEKKFNLKFNDHEMTFLPNESIDLLSIRTYYLPTLIEFIKERDFEFIEEVVVENMAGVFFKKYN